MRTAPVSALKGSRAGRTAQPRPQPGTALGDAFDLFQANKALPILFSHRGRNITDLVDYYGLDIRRVGKKQYCLVGEWFGKIYIDYLAEKFSKERCEA